MATVNKYCDFIILFKDFKIYFLNNLYNCKDTSNIKILGLAFLSRW